MFGGERWAGPQLPLLWPLWFRRPDETVVFLGRRRHHILRRRFCGKDECLSTTSRAKRALWSSVISYTEASTLRAFVLPCSMESRPSAQL